MSTQTVSIRPYDDADEPDVVAVLTECLPIAAPHNDPRTSIRRKLAVDRGLFLVAQVDGRVVGTAMGGYDGHRGWVYSVAVLPSHQRCGIGRKLMQAVEAALVERDCPKVNLQVLTSNAGVVAFYESLGYAVEERVSMGKKLY